MLGGHIMKCVNWDDSLALTDSLSCFGFVVFYGGDLTP